MSALESRYFSVKEAAALLRISEDKVYELCTSGALRSHRPPKLARRLIPESALAEFLDGSSVASVIELRRSSG